MYYNQSKEEVISNLKTCVKGLDMEEVNYRHQQHGYNKIIEGKRKNVVQVFLSQFADLLVVILIASTIISLFTGNADSAIVIICVLMMNAILGTIQHFKAEKSLNSLKALSEPIARVVRNGSVCEIPAVEVCAGDILMLEAGNIATADGRIIESASLSVNESCLTGESNDILKTSDIITSNDNKQVMLGDRKNMIYSGSLITGGRGTMVVTDIGMSTEMGKIATLINNAQRKKTPLQKSLDRFSQWLSLAIIAISALVMVFSLARGENIVNSLMFAVALAVAAIPEALSSIVTISLAIGTQKMAKENAIVKDLKSVEGLGCVSIICSDKTGTLTQNKMTVRKAYINQTVCNQENLDANSITCYNMLLAMVLCNDAVCGKDAILGDPTETALIDCYGKNCCEEERNKFPRISEIPFDSTRKLMSTLHVIDGKITMFTKGAVDVLLNRLTKIMVDGEVRDICEDDIEKIRQTNQQFSQNGMRVICFAKKLYENKNSIDFSDENDYIFIGLVGMTDPPRKESQQAVAECILAGIKPIMITGDHKITAIAIAKEIGFFKEGDLSFDGSELEEISDEE
ncbi:MAG: HAD-IC family P-type ATPase, partial [Oscillospiraceae bacterium]